MKWQFVFGFGRMAEGVRRTYRTFVHKWSQCPIAADAKHIMIINWLEDEYVGCVCCLCSRTIVLRSIDTVRKCCNLHKSLFELWMWRHKQLARRTRMVIDRSLHRNNKCRTPMNRDKLMGIHFQYICYVVIWCCDTCTNWLYLLLLLFLLYSAK